LVPVPEFVARWSRIGLSAQLIDHEEAERAIAALYAWAGLAEPGIIWAPCRMTALLSAVLSSRLRHYRSGEDTIFPLLLDQLAQRALAAAVPQEAGRRIRIAVEQVLTEACSFADSPPGGSGATVAIDNARRAMLRLYAEAVSPAIRDALRQLLIDAVRPGILPFQPPLLNALRAADAGLGRRYAHSRGFGAPRWLGTAALLDFLTRVLKLPFIVTFSTRWNVAGHFGPWTGFAFPSKGRAISIGTRPASCITTSDLRWPTPRAGAGGIGTASGSRTM
jgi:hypothetical protein